MGSLQQPAIAICAGNISFHMQFLLSYCSVYQEVTPWTHFVACKGCWKDIYILYIYIYSKYLHVMVSPCIWRIHIWLSKINIWLCKIYMLCRINIWSHRIYIYRIYIIYVEYIYGYVGCKYDYLEYCQTSNITSILGNKIVGHSNVVRASPVGATPTTSSFST